MYKEVIEAYTSQICSQCGVIRKMNRIIRGLYYCKQYGLNINADVNGALNIGSKVASNVFNYTVKGCRSSGRVNRPQRIRVVTFSQKLMH